MRTDERNKGLQLSQSALPEMRARLALLNTAISALQRYQGQSDPAQSDKEMGDNASDVVRPRPFLVARRDHARAEKAS
jgi:hypothetical protein